MKWNPTLGFAVSTQTILFAKLISILLTEAFYLMVGSYYYLWSRSDWVYTSVYNSMMQNKLN